MIAPLATEVGHLNIDTVADEIGSLAGELLSWGQEDAWEGRPPSADRARLRRLAKA